MKNNQDSANISETVGDEEVEVMLEETLDKQPESYSNYATERAIDSYHDYAELKHSLISDRATVTRTSEGPSTSTKRSYLSGEEPLAAPKYCHHVESYR
jgi:hypothetical protein